MAKRRKPCWWGAFRSDVVWDGLEERDGGKPGGGGFAEWAPFAPQVKVYSRTRGRCFHVRLSGGRVGIFVLYNRGERWGESIRAHERHHVVAHMRPAYADYRRAAAALGRVCMSRPRAEWVGAVILNQLRAEYIARSYRDATRHDWEAYGRRASAEVRRDAWERMTTWSRRYATARKATAVALAAGPAD